jgi:hypothetical protein
VRQAGELSISTLRGGPLVHDRLNIESVHRTGGTLWTRGALWAFKTQHAGVEANFLPVAVRASHDEDA